MPSDIEHIAGMRDMLVVVFVVGQNFERKRMPAH
jgi:hypothetical protein